MRRTAALALGLSLAFVLVAPSARPVQVATTVDTLVTLEIGSGGLTVGPDGTIYLSDFGSRLGGNGVGGHRVMTSTPDGVVTELANVLRGASGSELMPDGTFFQSNIGANKISRIAPDGTVTDFVSEGIVNPVGIASDPAGNLYVANCRNGSIQKLTPAGESSRLVQSPILQCPNGITRDEAGNLYVANFSDGNVVKIAPDSTVSVLATLPGNNNGHLTYHDGALWVVARTAHQIYRVTPDGESQLVAGSGTMGGADGPALEAEFIYPNDLGFSPDGRILYVNDIGAPSDDGRLLAPTRLRRIHMGS